jgi:hypothetical protein
VKLKLQLNNGFDVVAGLGEFSRHKTVHGQVLSGISFLFELLAAPDAA